MLVAVTHAVPQELVAFVGQKHHGVAGLHIAWIGLLKEHRVEFAVRDKSKPLGIATYQTLHDIPKQYQTLTPVIEGVRRVLAENAAAERK